MLFTWKEDFSVNIEDIDKQHKELFRIGSRLYTIVSLKDGIDRYDEIIEILYELKDYAEYHFSFEEELMKKYGYDGTEDQIKAHKKFIEKVISISEEEVDIEQKKMGMDLILFIANWIENHILKSDMGYKDFLNEKGVY
ncbi:bacteriohemerythrin [Anaerosalibacter massiliensis]|uniref:Bacteriohemerythrin n=1 Tax=Anaerosalibacter massiliensis TaxID=1347392 RepID=A0A9X2S4U9_9FIRM|nr:bacteriohemerythrin [Anaerosalibacter massiliensis]MCR2043664.1 bacteriohemerythrin [Anaerosalibacter massiliensis]